VCLVASGGGVRPARRGSPGEYRSLAGLVTRPRSAVHALR
jgi:hypothetical protein